MKVLRTPESCFENLPGYDVLPHYQMIEDDDGTHLRVHYLDEGPETLEGDAPRDGRMIFFSCHLNRQLRTGGLMMSTRRFLSIGAPEPNLNF